MATKSNESVDIIDGTRDLTEKDIARMRYYQLFQEQSARNLQRQINFNKKAQEYKAVKIAAKILGLIFLIYLMLVIVHDLSGKN